MVSSEGFEPSTDRLEGDCSIQLSYEDICFPNLPTPQKAGNPFLLITRELQLRSLFILKSLKFKMAGEEGLEPTTPRLTVACSNQLSYTPMVEDERFELPFSCSQSKRRRPNWANPRY